MAPVRGRARTRPAGRGIRARLRQAALAATLAALTAASGCAALAREQVQWTPAGAPASPAAPMAARLDAAVTAAMKQLGIPGAVVGITVPGRLDYAKAFGVGDDTAGTPMRLDDRFRIGGVTKTFAGTAIMQLVDRHRISLTDPIAKYVDGVPSGDRITLRMLGDMRSGLFSFEQDPAFVAAVLTELPKGPTAGAVTPQQLLEITARHPLNFAPGSRYECVDINAVLLGMVVEKVSGQPLAEYFQQHIFAPLGLTRTSFPADGAMPAPYAHGYGTDVTGTVVDASPWNPSWAGAAGAMVSTYPDLKIWTAALAKGALLTPEAQQQRLAQVDQTGAAAPYRFAISGVGGWWGHHGSIPGYTTVAMAMPEQNATLVVLAGTDVPEEHAAGKLAEIVTTIVTPDHVYRLPTATPPPGGAPAPGPSPHR